MINTTTLKILASSMLALGLCMPVANAQNTMASCADIEDRDRRLNCYDAIAESNQAQPVVRLPRVSRPRSEGVNDTGVAVTSDDFGREPQEEEQENPPENATRPEASAPDVRTYVVSAAKHNDFTGWTIEFEGGGTWKQVGTDDFDINVGERYTVRRTFFNSYQLSGENSNRKIRVTRMD